MRVKESIFQKSQNFCPKAPKTFLSFKTTFLMVYISALTFNEYAAQFLRKQTNFVTSCQYRAVLGIDCYHTEIIWGYIAEKVKKLEPKHLFWGLTFLKVYSSEEVHSALCQTTRKTYRTWSWAVVHAISDLDIVSSLIPFFFFKF